MAGQKAFFVHGFGKNEKTNISPKELQDFKALAPALLGASEAQLSALLRERRLEELTYGEDENL